MSRDLVSRLIQAEDELFSAVLSGSDAAVAFNASFETLVDDCRTALHEGRLDDTTQRQVYAISTNVMHLSTFFASTFSHLETFQSTYLEDVEQILSNPDVEDKNDSLTTPCEKEASLNTASRRKLPNFIAPAFHWLQDNLWNPYPDKATIALIAKSADRPSDAITTWFNNMRRRIGWTDILRKHFNKDRKDAAKVARIWLDDEYVKVTQAPKGTLSEAARDLILMKAEVQKLRERHFEKGDLANALDATIADAPVDSDVRAQRARNDYYSKRREIYNERRKQERAAMKNGVQDGERRHENTFSSSSSLADDDYTDGSLNSEGHRTLRTMKAHQRFRQSTSTSEDDYSEDYESEYRRLKRWKLDLGGRSRRTHAERDDGECSSLSDRNSSRKRKRNVGDSRTRKRKGVNRFNIEHDSEDERERRSRPHTSETELPASRQIKRRRRSPSVSEDEEDRRPDKRSKRELLPPPKRRRASNFSDDVDDEEYHPHSSDRGSRVHRPSSHKKVSRRRSPSWSESSDEGSNEYNSRKSSGKRGNASTSARNRGRIAVNIPGEMEQFYQESSDNASTKVTAPVHELPSTLGNEGYKSVDSTAYWQESNGREALQINNISASRLPRASEVIAGPSTSRKRRLSESEVQGVPKRPLGPGGFPRLHAVSDPSFMTSKSSIEQDISDALSQRATPFPQFSSVHSSAPALALQTDGASISNQGGLEESNFLGLYNSNQTTPVAKSDAAGTFGHCHGYGLPLDAHTNFAPQFNADVLASFAAQIDTNYHAATADDQSLPMTPPAPAAHRFDPLPAEFGSEFWNIPFFDDYAGGIPEQALSYHTTQAHHQSQLFHQQQPFVDHGVSPESLMLSSIYSAVAAPLVSSMS